MLIIGLIIIIHRLQVSLPRVPLLSPIVAVIVGGRRKTSEERKKDGEEKEREGGRVGGWEVRAIYGNRRNKLT